MSQLALNFSAPPLAQARAVGQAAQKLATDRAEREEPDFRARAQALILERLSAGQASGEDCTDYVRDRLPMATGKALGSIYAKLLRDKAIHRVAPCRRRCGNGTWGGSIYALGGALGD